ncbi:WRC domain-containing protein [Cinnamomum micranthum f. kanehirae]|uniref:WRC domain-containing protein n=1 Tax=Cinnamomum micranthum f. kanehirae TaxID=337451 RepID=A0A443PYX0_9MAGN|nr:WRC domain-containing protein [Cinnamomum micranthum f. kanehirae]
MRIRKRWPLTSHLPPLTSTIPDRPPFSAPSDHRNQHPQQEEDEGRKKGILSRGDRRGRGLHPNGDAHLVHDRVMHRPISNLHPTLLISKRNGWIRTYEGMPPHPQALKGKEEEEEEEEEDDDDDEDEEEEKGDNVEKWVEGEKRSSSGMTMRIGNNSSTVEMAARLMLPPFSSSHQEMECEGERVFSFKKRRGERGHNYGVAAVKEKKMTQKTHYLAAGDEDKEVVREWVDGESKKKGRGNGSCSDAVALEGSRCSRVNGRGWRCSQQTLVGYALCEHHLGKGRLRNISSVRSRSPAITTQKNNVGGDSNNSSDSILSLSFTLQDEALGEEEEEDDDDNDGKEEEEEEGNAMMEAAIVKKKRRKKIGMVKARSINSLLDQTHHGTYTVRP